MYRLGKAVDRVRFFNIVLSYNYVLLYMRKRSDHKVSLYWYNSITSALSFLPICHNQRLKYYNVI